MNKRTQWRIVLALISVGLFCDVHTTHAATTSPTLSAPATGSFNTIHLSYNLPDTPLAGSVSVAFETADHHYVGFSMTENQFVSLMFSPTTAVDTVTHVPTLSSSVSGAFNCFHMHYNLPEPSLFQF